MKQKDIFMAFFRTGLLGYGGGPSSIPLVHKEVVKTYDWLSDEEFGKLLAIANTLPGPICTKMAGVIGYQVGGILGMLNGLLAAVIPTVLLMILFLTGLRAFSEITWIQGLTYGVIPIVSLMLWQLTGTFIKEGIKSLGLPVTLFHLLVAIVLLEVIGLHPGILIVCLMMAAIFKGRRKPT